jgi:hypothetical protein
MDLALALGQPSVTRMLEAMTDQDLDGWVAYAKKNGLPQKRQELYLAQVAQVSGGGKLDAYLLRRAENEATPDEGTADHFLRIAGATVSKGKKG